MFTKRFFAKKAIHMTIASTVAKSTRTFIDNHSDIDVDTTSVKIGTAFVGDYVASKTDRLTDPMVDKIADKIEARKADTTVTE